MSGTCWRAMQGLNVLSYHQQRGRRGEGEALVPLGEQRCLHPPRFRSAHDREVVPEPCLRDGGFHRVGVLDDLQVNPAGLEVFSCLGEALTGYVSLSARRDHVEDGDLYPGVSGDAARHLQGGAVVRPPEVGDQHPAPGPKLPGQVDGYVGRRVSKSRLDRIGRTHVVGHRGMSAQEYEVSTSFLSHRDDVTADVCTDEAERVDRHPSGFFQQWT